MPSWATVGTIAAVYGVDTYVRDMRRISSETARTGLAVTAATRMMNGNVVSGLGNSLTNVGMQINRIGNNISSLGFAWTTTFGAMVTAGVIASAKLGSEFEQTINRIAALTGTSRDALAAWSQTILRLAPTLGKMPNDLAKSLYFIKSIGIDDIATELELLKQSSMAASLGMGEIESITKSVVSIFKVFGKEGYDIREITNALLVTVRLAAFEADGLATSFARVLPVGMAVGASLSGLLGYMAGASRLGFTASQAATSLLNALNFLADPTTEAKNALDEYNMSIEGVRESVAGRNGLDATLLILAETMGKDVSRLFTNRATSGVLALASISDEYRAITQEIEDSLNLQAGQLSELEEAFKDYSTTVNFAWEATKAGAAAVSIQLFQSLKAPLTDILLQLTDYLSKLQLIIYNNPILAATILKIAAAAALLGPALIILGTLIRSIGNIVVLLSVPIRLLGYGLGFLSGGAGMLARVLAGPLIYGVTAVYSAVTNTITASRIFFRVLSEGGGITLALTRSFGHLSSMISRLAVIDLTRNAFLRFGGSIVLANRAVIALLLTVSRFGFSIPGMIARMTTSFAILRANIRTVGGVFPWLFSIASGVFGRIFSVGGGIAGRLAGIWVAASVRIGAALQLVGQRLIALRIISTGVAQRIVIAFGNAFLVIGGMMTSLRVPIAMMIGGVMTSLRGMAAGVTGLFAGMAARVSAILLGMMTAVLGRITTLFTAQIAALLTGVMGVIGTIATTVIGAVIQSIVALVPVVVSAVGTAVGVLSGLAAAILSIASPIVAIGAAVAGAILLISGIAGAVSRIFGRIRSIARQQTPGLAGEMRGYGRNIIESFSRGMLDGLIAVVQALRYIASVIRAWLQPGSPPRILPDLDIWGSQAMSEYMKGWTQIDFSAFKEISDSFRAFFESLLAFDAEPADQAGVIANLIGFRDILARAINDIDAVGFVSDTIWDRVNAGLRGASYEMQNYTRLTLRAAEAQERVKDIQDQITRLQKAYDVRLKPLNDRLKEIADIRDDESDEMRIEELQRILNDPRADERTKMLARLEIEEIGIRSQVEAIEAERDPQLDALNAQLALAEQQYELLAAQQEQAKAILDLQIEQNELLKEQLRLLEEQKEKDKAAKEEKEEAGDGGGIGEPLPELGEVGGVMEGLEDFESLGIGDPLGDLDNKLGELQTEFRGLMGEIGGIFGIIGDKIRTFWEGTAKPIFDEIVNHPFTQEIWTTLRETVGKTIDRFNEMKPSLDSAKGAMSSLLPIVRVIGLVILGLVSAFSGLIVNMGGIFGSILTRLTELKPAIDRITQGLRGIVEGILLLVQGGPGGWETLGAGIWTFLSGIGLLVEGVFWGLVDIGGRILASIAQFVLDFVDRILRGIQETTGISTENLRAWIAEAKTKLTKFLTNTDNWGLVLKEKIRETWHNIRDRFVEAWTSMTASVSEKIEAIRSTINEKVTAVRGYFSQFETKINETKTKFDAFKQALTRLIGNIYLAIFQRIFGIKRDFSNLEERVSAFELFFTTFKNSIVTAITRMKEAVEEQINLIKAVFRTLFVVGLELWERLVDAFKLGVKAKIEDMKNGLSTSIRLIIDDFNSFLDTMTNILNWLNTHVFRIRTEGELPATGGGGSGAGGSTNQGQPEAAATGGPVRRGRTYLVGERGMELFTPDRNGYIVPNHELIRRSNSPVVSNPHAIVAVETNAPVINFGDTNIFNTPDALKFKAMIRATVLEMVK